jgi:hypothetical protein
MLEKSMRYKISGIPIEEPQRRKSLILDIRYELAPLVSIPGPVFWGDDHE